MEFDKLGEAVLATLAFSGIGLALFGLAFWLMEVLTPFSVRKEIEEEHNTALAVIMGAVVLGIAIIVAAAIHG
jgi:uncharacterized membrane protein YjfL (UPF0719 family)